MAPLTHFGGRYICFIAAGGVIHHWVLLGRGGWGGAHMGGWEGGAVGPSSRLHQISFLLVLAICIVTGLRAGGGRCGGR